MSYDRIIAAQQHGYAHMKSLGEGSFGAVTAVKKRDDTSRKPELFAMKIFQGKNTERFDTEMKVLEKESFPYVLVMEYVEREFGEPEFQKGVSPERAKKYFEDLICGISFMHGKLFVHCDIKPANLLLTKNDVLKIADFGLSVSILADEYIKSHRGTRYTMSPEMVEVDKFVHGRSADVWSIGVMLMYFFIGMLPFNEATSECDFYMSWIAGESSVKLPWQKIAKEPMDLIRKILVVDVKSRATLKSISKDPWIMGGEDQVKDVKKPRFKKVKAEKKKVQVQKVEKAIKESAKDPKSAATHQKKNVTKQRKQEKKATEDLNDLKDEKPEKIPKRQPEKRKQDKEDAENAGDAENLKNRHGPSKRQRVPKRQWAE
ncbi:hypothetical protein L3Y34_013812 [Caenorhabditis briggsae]|uniref:Protein kinase domain-containing protein n=2 Tax=Caenorhabditis briggsae TaxID=6238 RepID=A0AAE9CY03_CAEBR|nr:hypothetical protein L3Y34_013811 [Caenorhabditis briggsae]ULT85275.1 hypothetical protein L3Y34_013812 [Caenorhabditis briggsae]